MAFSKDLRVTISRGLISFSIRIRICFPAAMHSSSLLLLIAGLDELYGNDIPKASIAEAIVFAVYIPPQAPAPGIDFLIMDL